MSRFDEYVSRLREETSINSNERNWRLLTIACQLLEVEKSIGYQEKRRGYCPQLPISEDAVASDPVYQMLDTFLDKFKVCYRHRQKLGIDKKILGNIQDQVFSLKHLLTFREMEKDLYQELYEIHEMSKENPLEVESLLLDLCVSRYFTRKINQK